MWDNPKTKIENYARRHDDAAVSPRSETVDEALKSKTETDRRKSSSSFRDQSSFHDTYATSEENKQMTKQRGNLRPRQGLMEGSNTINKQRCSAAASNKNQEVVLSSPPRAAESKGSVHRVRQKAKQLRAFASTSRSNHGGSDSVSLETEGTGISTLTSSSGGREQPQLQRKVHTRQLPRSHIMSPPNFTIFEDELQSRATQSSYISRPIDVDSMQEYEEEESRATQSSFISRPIDVDSMQEYEEALKPARSEPDDLRSRTTASTYSSRPIDVDSVLEYDPEEYSETPHPEDECEKNLNFNNGYYEGESLLEYSSDDQTIDFETGLASDPRRDCEGRVKASEQDLKTNVPPNPPRKDRDEPQLRVSSLKRLQTHSKPRAAQAVTVDLVGPIHADSCLLTVAEDESVENASFRDWEFPILDEREFERELVGYIEGFEPYVEDLPPRGSMGRNQSDATSTRSSNTRVTFEI